MTPRSTVFVHRIALPLVGQEPRQRAIDQLELRATAVAHPVLEAGMFEKLFAAWALRHVAAVGPLRILDRRLATRAYSKGA